MYPKGASLTGTLLWSKGASEGGALLSTVARAGLPCLHPQGATLVAVILCTKGTRHRGALQLGPYIE
jgi:hypothetical protein